MAKTYEELMAERQGKAAAPSAETLELKKAGLSDYDILMYERGALSAEEINSRLQNDRAKQIYQARQAALPAVRQQAHQNWQSKERAQEQAALNLGVFRAAADLGRRTGETNVYTTLSPAVEHMYSSGPYQGAPIRTTAPPALSAHEEVLRQSAADRVTAPMKEAQREREQAEATAKISRIEAWKQERPGNSELNMPEDYRSPAERTLDEHEGRTKSDRERIAALGLDELLGEYATTKAADKKAGLASAKSSFITGQIPRAASKRYAEIMATDPDAEGKVQALERDRVSAQGQSFRQTVAIPGAPYVLSDLIVDNDNKADRNSTRGLLSEYGTDEERFVHSYIFATQGRKAADEYLSAMSTSVAARKAQEIYEKARATVEDVQGTDGALLRGAKQASLAVGAGFEQWIHGFSNFAGLMEGRDYYIPSHLQTASGAVLEELGGTWGSAGGVALTGLQTISSMIPSILIGKGVGALAGAAGAMAGGIQAATTAGTGAAIFLTASGNGYANGIAQGLSPTEAAGYGLLTGASEAVLQVMIGGIVEAGGGLASKTLSTAKGQSFLNAIDGALKSVVTSEKARFLLRVGISMAGDSASEFFEESLQSILEPLFLNLVTGEDIAEINLKEAIRDGLMGAIVALSMNSIPAVRQSLAGFGTIDHIQALNEVRAPLGLADVTVESDIAAAVRETDAALASLQSEIEAAAEAVAQAEKEAAANVNPVEAAIDNLLATGEISSKQMEAILKTDGGREAFTERTGVELPRHLGDARRAIRSYQATVTPQTVTQTQGTTAAQINDSAGDIGTASVTQAGVSSAVESDTDTQNLAAPAGTAESWLTSRAVPEGEVMRLSNILHRAVQQLQVPINRGNIQGGRNVAGQYINRVRSIRLRTNNDVVTASHEIGHMLDDVYNVESQFSQQARGELAQNTPAFMRTVYDEAQLPAEGLAEFFRQYFSNKADAQTEFPAAYAEIMSILPDDVVGIIDGLATEINRYLSAPASERFRQALSMPEDVARATPGEFVEDAKIRFIEKWEDDLHGLQRFGEGVENLAAYRLAQNYRYVGGQIDYLLKRGFTDMQGKEIGKSLLAELGGKVNVGNKAENAAFNELLMLQAAVDRVGQGIRVFSDPTLQNAQAIQQRIAELRAKYPQWKDADEGVYRYIKRLVDVYGVGSGILSQQAVAEWRKQTPHYVPLYRDMSDTGRSPSHSGSQRGTLDSARVVRSMRGSGREVTAPLENIVRLTERMVRAAKINEIRRTMAEAANATSGSGLFVERVPAPTQAQRINGEAIKQAIARGLSEQSGVDRDGLMRVLDTVIEDDLVQFSKGGPPGRDVMTVLRNGTPEYWRINDPSLVRALGNLEPKTASAFLEAYGKATRLVTTMATGANIIWSIGSNLVRDLQTAAVHTKSRNLGKYLLNIGNAYFLRSTDKLTKTSSQSREYMREYLALGGGQNISIITASRPDMAKSFSGLLSRQQYINPLRGIGAVSDIVEAAPRIAEYMVRRKDGIAPQEAFYDAMEVTTNFRRGGTTAREVNKVIPFSNANIQGFSKALRHFSASDVTGPGRTKVASQRIAKWVTLSAIMAIGTSIRRLFDDEEKEAYEQLSTYNKNGAWNIYLGDGKFFSIRKPRELGLLASLIERTMEFAIMDNPKAFEHFAQYAFGEITPPLLDFLPTLIFEGSDAAMGSFINSLGPTGSLIAPFVNLDYRGIAIVPQSMQGLPPEMQYDQSTSRVSKELGQFFQISPKKIDYTLQTWLGMYQTINRSLLPVGGEERDWSMGIANTYIKDNLFSQDIVNRFYDAKSAADMAHKRNEFDWDARIKSADYDRIGTFYSRSGNLARTANMEADVNRETRQNILDMLEQATSDQAHPVKNQLNDIAEQVKSTEFFPQIMDTVLRYHPPGKLKTEIALNYAQYFDYQTSYYTLYYDEMAKVVNRKFYSENDLMSALRKAKTTAKDRADRAMYQKITGQK